MTKVEAFEILENAAWLGTNEDREKVEKAIETLEGAWADEWCLDCKEYDQEKCCCHRWNKVIRDTVEELRKQRKGTWETGMRPTPYPWSPWRRLYRWCSECGFERKDGDPDKDTPYCPECGAYMGGANGK